ncbi:MAG: DNA polymerase III subunit [Clostridiales bacterium]|nr:DNA polymerase III subunit [Clostridiales bacterium]
MKVIGNQALLEQIGEAVKNRRMFHACIISGPRGIGKKTLAKHIATAAVCTEVQPPCGRCSGCLKSEKDIHPDIDHVKPDGTEIKVNQIRSLRASLYTLPNEAPCRVAVIENADCMNVNAQNAMLTILEEPPSSVIILLICENESELLPTIRSRCVHYRMQPLPEEIIKDELLRRKSGISADEAVNAAKKSDGILGRALEIIEAAAGDGYDCQIIEALCERSVERLITLAATLEKEANRDNLCDMIRSVQKTMGNAAAFQAGKSDNWSADERRLASVYDKKAIIRMYQLCTALIGYCEANVGVGHIVGAFASMLSEEVNR